MRRKVRQLAALGLTVLAMAPAGTARATASRPPVGVGAPLPADAAAPFAAELVGLRLHSDAYDRAIAAYDHAGTELLAVRDARAGAEATLTDLAAREVAIAEQITRFSTEEQHAADALAAARLRMQRVAVAAYVSGGDARQLAAVLDSSSLGELDRRRRLMAAVHADQAEAADELDAAREAASGQVSRAVAEHEANRAEMARIEAVVAQAAAGEERWVAELERRRAEVSRTAATAIVVGTELPLVVLDAYYRAAGAMRMIAPACAIRWSAVAGIGRVESQHGTYRGASPNEVGDVAPRIIGIPLDGTNQTQLIGDSDGGALDGDPVVDRAVGPMQFIPQTWDRFAFDGNGDGRRDPHNLYDAAVSTATYLCRAAPPGGLVDEHALRQSFFSYNHSEEYAASVLGWSQLYDGLGLPLP